MIISKFKTEGLKQRFILILLESTLIVFGVLLGYFANQWRITESNQQKAEAALFAIQTELESNYQQVKKLLPSHKQMEDSLDVLINGITNGTLTHVSSIQLQQAMPGGFSVPLLRTSAWDMATQTGAINYIGFDLVKDLSALYKLQNFYQSKLDTIGENWYVAGNINPNNFISTTMAMGILVNDIVLQEEDLVKNYPNLIQKLGVE